MSATASAIEMKANEGSLSPILERHTPQHPLPQEIQNMENDETVCQFCGVSYLIHHEIKRLEDQVELLEKELVQCRASKENEKKLRSELKKLNDSFSSLQSLLKEKDATIDRMTHTIEGQKNGIDELHREKARLILEESNLKSTFRNHNQKIQNQAKRLSDEIKSLKIELNSLKSNVEPMQQDFSSYIEGVKKDVQILQMSSDAENSQIREQLSLLQLEVESRERNEDQLQNIIRSMQNEIKNVNQGRDEKSNELREENEKLHHQNTTIQNKNTELLQDVATLQSQLKIINSDSVQMKEALSKKEKELQSAVQKLHMTENDAELTIQRMNQEIKHLEKDLIELNKERQKWKSVENSLKKQQEELRSQMSANSGESQQLFDSLQEAKNESVTLKGEREQMVMSHQNQIMQLRDSFREKLNEAHGNPQELEEKLQNLRSSHENEMREFEIHLKENHSIEMGLQKERHEEEMRTCLERFTESATENETDLTREMQRYINETKILQQQIMTMKTDYSEQIQEQEKEKTSLKRIISQLEEKITSMMGEQEGISITSQAEARELRKKLLDVEKEKSVIEKENNDLKEEVSVLQETVRRECEERFELTEALSTLREQLKLSASSDSLMLRAPVSAINGAPRNDVIQRPKLSAKTLKNLEMNNNTLPNPKALLPDVLPKQALAKRASSDLQYSANGDYSPHVKDISFASQPSPPLGKQSPVVRSTSEESVESVRRRIAAVIKRK